MARAFLNFNRVEALNYQLQMAREMLQVYETDLQRLQRQASATQQTREMVTGCPETWKPLMALMRPTAGQMEADKILAFKEKIVEFLKAKIDAINLVLNDQKDPKVCV